MRVKGWRVWKLLASCSLLLSSCGYRWQSDFPFEERPLLAISSISGDDDASFVKTIAHAFSTSGLTRISHRDADYRLEVEIFKGETETIGYRFNSQKNFGKVRKNLVATEGRKSLAIEATFYNASSGDLAYGPYRLSAYADYDFLDGDSIQDLTFQNQAGATVTVLPFSLGQLEPNEAAQQAALQPLYTQLAKKIVDALSAEW